MDRLLKSQDQISPQMPMPVEDVHSSSQVAAITGETVQLYYYNAGVRTSDAGQAAGVVVDAKTAYNNILNSIGHKVGVKGDTSLSFTSTALTAEVAMSATIKRIMEGYDQTTAAAVAAAVGELLTNGQYVVDYSRGLIIGRKASNTTTLAATAYSVNRSYLGTVTVDSEFPTAAALADATANPTTTSVASMMHGFNGTTWDRIRAGISAATTTLTGWLNVLPAARYNVAPTTRTEGQVGLLQAAPNGSLSVRSDAYDAASQSDRSIVANPVSEQYAEETLIDLTNVAAATNYYPSTTGLPMAGFRSLSVQGNIAGGVTVTIEATNDDAASPDWHDITLAFTNLVTGAAAAASYVDTNFLLSLADLNVRAVRIKSVTSDATNGVQYNIRRKAL
jgi:hypothetical protein